jgi:RNA polymerase sigma-70 factor (ECF subfamily)
MTADAHDPERARRFRELALPHLDEVYTLARYLMRNSVDAEDAVQDSYLRAFRHFDTFRGDAVRPWLFAILRNVCKGSYSRRMFADDEPADHAEPLWSEAIETPEAAMLRHCDEQSMRDMVSALPEVFREVIVLREINDMSYREIADIVEVPVGTVMSRLARGRAMLREAWLAAEENTR